MQPFLFSRFWPLLAPLLNTESRRPAPELLITRVTAEPQQAESGTLLFWSAAQKSAGAAAVAAAGFLSAAPTNSAARASVTPGITAPLRRPASQLLHAAATFNLIIITDILNQICQPPASQPDLMPLVLHTAQLSNCYWRFIAYYRSRFTLPVIGVSGTCGKTTVIEMLRTITAQQQALRPSQASCAAGGQRLPQTTAPPDYVFTDIGCNLLKDNLQYLLRFEQHTRAAFLELGVTHPGCISRSCCCFKPAVGVLLNVGVYHLQGCRTLSRYLQAKTELLAALPASGSIIYNADDSLTRQLDWRKCRAQLIAIGERQPQPIMTAVGLSGPAAFYQIKNVHCCRSGLRFTLSRNSTSLCTLSLPVLGRHNAVNAAAAAICCRLLGISWPAITGGLQRFRPPAHHLQLKKSPQGWYILDDSWNCTPPAMLAALQTLKELALELNARSIALLGEMPNLGAAGSGQYRQIGRTIAGDSVCDELLLSGQLQLQALGAAAQAGGFPAARIHYCRTAPQVAARLQQICRSADTVKQTVTAQAGSSPLLRPVSRPLIILLKIPYTFLWRQQAQWRHLMRCLGLES